MSPKERNASRDGFVNCKYLSTALLLRKPRAFRTRVVVSLLAYKTLSIDRNNLELAIKKSILAYFKHVKKVVFVLFWTLSFYK